MSDEQDVLRAMEREAVASAYSAVVHGNIKKAANKLEAATNVFIDLGGVAEPGVSWGGSQHEASRAQAWGEVVRGMANGEWTVRLLGSAWPPTESEPVIHGERLSREYSVTKSRRGRPYAVGSVSAEVLLQRLERLRWEEQGMQLYDDRMLLAVVFISDKPLSESAIDWIRLMELVEA